MKPLAVKRGEAACGNQVRSRLRFRSRVRRFVQNRVSALLRIPLLQFPGAWWSVGTAAGGGVSRIFDLGEWLELVR